MEKVMVIMRGIPGSGKSTISQIIGKGLGLDLEKCVICSTDDFFKNKKGQYKFNPKKIKENHLLNQLKAMKACIDKKNVIIDNTNVDNDHLKPYLDIAAEYGYRVYNLAVIVDQMEAFKRQTHNVPEEAHKRMHNKLLESIQEYGNAPYEVDLPDYIDDSSKE